MALEKKVESSTGLSINNAYIKVDEYSCNKDSIVNARLRAYVSKELADNGASYIEGTEDIITMYCNYGDNSDNTKKQIYEFAKTLEKYSNAIDC